MPARLTVHFALRPAKVHLLPEQRETVVGRDPTCDVTLDDDRVSWHHARLVRTDAGWTVTDLASKNGTAVDGVGLGQGLLGERCWISFGGLPVRFELLAGGAETEELERLRRWQTSLELQRQLDPALGLQELLRRVVTSILVLSGAERGCVLLAKDDGTLEIAEQSGSPRLDLRDAKFGGSLGAVERALASGEPVVASDVLADASLGERPSVIQGGFRVLVCVPVRALDRVLGALYADSRRPGAAFTELDVEILAALASQAGLATAVARLGAELNGLADRLEAPGEATR